MTTVLITGDRHWYCIKIARVIIERLKSRYNDLEIIHGDCRTKKGSADQAFNKAAIEAGIQPKKFKADWDNLENSAGPTRNQEMVDYVSKLDGQKFAIALHKSLSFSRGTKDCVKKLRAAKIPVYLIDNDEGNARRI
jgi:hypothetical protein